MSNLSISIQENVFVQDFVGVLRSFIQIALKLKRIVAEDIKNWYRANKAVSVNGPPVLGVSVSDDSNVKTVFGR
jgi:hypothetical protein